nr:hypothetical protein [Armatimonas sp.]
MKNDSNTSDESMLSDKKLPPSENTLNNKRMLKLTNEINMISSFLTCRDPFKYLYKISEIKINEINYNFLTEKEYELRFKEKMMIERKEYESNFKRIQKELRKGGESLMLSSASYSYQKIRKNSSEEHKKFIQNTKNKLDRQKVKIYIYKYISTFIESMLSSYAFLKVSDFSSTDEFALDKDEFTDGPVLSWMIFNNIIVYKFDIYVLIKIYEIINNLEYGKWIDAINSLDEKLWDIHSGIEVEECMRFGFTSHAAMLATAWTSSKLMRTSVQDALNEQTQGRVERGVLQEIYTTTVRQLEVDEIKERAADGLPSRILDLIRAPLRKKRKRETEMTDEIEDMATPTPPPVSDLDLESLLPRLTPSQRALVECMKLLASSGEDLTHAKIARATGRSQQAISAMLKRIQTHFR